MFKNLESSGAWSSTEPEPTMLARILERENREPEPERTQNPPKKNQKWVFNEINGEIKMDKIFIDASQPLDSLGAGHIYRAAPCSASSFSFSSAPGGLVTTAPEVPLLPSLPEAPPAVAFIKLFTFSKAFDVNEIPM